METVARAGRWLLGAIFLVGAGVNLVLATIASSSYAGFADEAPPYIRHLWASVFMTHTLGFLALLIAFEATTGIFILRGRRDALLGLGAVIAFHAALMLFGWGFWPSSVPMMVFAAIVARETAREMRAQSVPVPPAAKAA
ncbi:MAG: hypothetical protein ACXVP8_05760 [Actinomycetota bacterium]